MRKGIIFIGWSKNKNLAIVLKNKLDANGYLGVIGGDYEGNDDSLSANTRTVSETITYQMNRCNQAILLFENKKDNTGAVLPISGNLIYETGFLSSKFNARENIAKLHLFKIDIVNEDSELFPTDMHGVWGTPLLRRGQNDEEVAQRIFDEFIRKQNLILSQDKMSVLNTIHSVGSELHDHFTNPQLSDYELATQLVFYTQARYIYQDISIAIEQCVKLQELLSSDKLRPVALSNSLQLAMDTLDLFRQVVASPDSRVNMEGRVFRNFIKKFNSDAYRIKEYSLEFHEDYDYSGIRFSEEDVQNDEFVVWAITQLQEHTTFLYLVYLDKEGINPEKRKELCEKALVYCNSVIANCKTLQKQESNEQYARLLLSYVYRNAYSFCKDLGREEDAEKYAQLSLETRKSLYRNIDSKPNINSSLKDYIALEYFVQLADSITTMKDEDEILDCLTEMGEYIRVFENHENSRTIVFSRFKNIYNGLVEKYKK